jgi:hypothetical protein
VTWPAAGKTRSGRSRCGGWGSAPDLPACRDVEQEPDAERDVYHRWHAALLIAPGRRYRLEYEGDMAAGRRI